MGDDRTHASFFSGVGGLDMGLERAGWRTVSFSEIDPYASAVLEERWPGVPNLGDITDLARAGSGGRASGQDADNPDPALVRPDQRSLLRGADGWPDESAADREWHRASLWTGGFPCQDLSVAGKRRGMGAGTRSGLAYAFLDLVGRHHPRFVLLENVPGLLSSHGGRDMAALVGALVELGYGVGYRVLDARHFGVPQRRRRVFILGISPGGRAGAERAAEVLSVGSRCRRHPPTGVEAGPGVAAGVDDGADIVGTVPAGLGHHGNGGHSSQAVASGHVIPGVRPSPYADRVRATDELARRSHDRDGLADTLRVGGRASGAGDSYDNTPWVAETYPTLRRGAHGDPGIGRDNDHERLVAFNPYRTLERDGSVTSGYAERDVVDALHGPTGNKEPLFVGALREHVRPGSNTDHSVITAGPVGPDPLLPLGLDSHRYRCCGNGVVADVSYWLGLRLLASLEASAA